MELGGIPMELGGMPMELGGMPIEGIMPDCGGPPFC